MVIAPGDRLQLKFNASPSMALFSQRWNGNGPPGAPMVQWMLRMPADTEGRWVPKSTALNRGYAVT